MTLRVPGTHDNMTHAISSVHDGNQTIVACSGDHRWIGDLTPDVSLNVKMDVRGEGQTRMLGRWKLLCIPFLQISSHGSFTDVTCAYATNQSGILAEGPQALFGIMGGPWRFMDCELRAAAADVLACFGVARVNASACVIGGMGRYDISNGTMLAIGGVHSADTSSVFLRSTVPAVTCMACITKNSPDTSKGF